MLLYARLKRTEQILSSQHLDPQHLSSRRQTLRLNGGERLRGSSANSYIPLVELHIAVDRLPPSPHSPHGGAGVSSRARAVPSDGPLHFAGQCSLLSSHEASGNRPRSRSCLASSATELER